MFKNFDIAIEYIIKFLLNGYAKNECVYYGEELPDYEGIKVWIKKSDFFSDSMYGTVKSIPNYIKKYLWNDKELPVLFGDASFEVRNELAILNMDIIASSYFVLSRYQEFIFSELRDAHGRFLAKDDLLFQSGYGQIPIVDMYGAFLRDLLRLVGVNMLPEKKGFGKIYLTHDIDAPFESPSLSYLLKEQLKLLLRKKTIDFNRFVKYFSVKKDPNYTFSRIVDYDNRLKDKLGDKVTPIYFCIVARANLKNGYCPINSLKYKNLINELKASGAVFGIHLSYEAGELPSKISDEVKRIPWEREDVLFSRNHYLRWREPKSVEYMEKSGITDDFTLTYADAVGFRVGTSRPYNFINPATGKVCELIIHPLNIMDCSLFYEEYMGLSFEDASSMAKCILELCYLYNGDVDLLWHNTTFAQSKDGEKLYVNLLEYIEQLYEKK